MASCFILVAACGVTQMAELLLEGSLLWDLVCALLGWAGGALFLPGLST